MARILHVCGWFDPAGDVVRCVRELNRHSRHEHRLIVRHRHPFQAAMEFDEAEFMQTELPDGWRDWAEAVLCHFVGWPPSWQRLDVPMGFRNLNIRYSRETGKFFSETVFNCADPKEFKLLAASHVGAREFLGPECRWLPDLLPHDKDEYRPDWTPRAQFTVSFIKQADEMNFVDFGPGIAKQNLMYRPHAEIMRQRKRNASVVVDNTIDGHWGLAGHEALLLGLPCFVYLHQKTHDALRSYVLEAEPRSFLDEEWLPFGQAENIKQVIEHVREMSTWTPDKYMNLRYLARAWAERHFNSERLIARFWDVFLDELVHA